MKLIDLNVLLYAVNRDSPHHERVRHWWQSAIDGDEPIALSWIVLLGFLRLTTRDGVFPLPLSGERACEMIGEWLTLPNVVVVTETEDHLAVLRELLSEAGVASGLTTDAHLAALAITHGATLVSCDHDFRRFSRLNWENPRDN